MVYKHRNKCMLFSFNMFFIPQKVRLGYCRVSLEMTGPYAAASGLFQTRSFCRLSRNLGIPCKPGTRSSWTQECAGFRTGRKTVHSVSIRAQLVEVRAMGWQ